jgi:hypothetical protein
MPGELERAIEAFVEHYNYQQYQEGLGDLTPYDVYMGRCAETIQSRKEARRKHYSQEGTVTIGPPEIRSKPQVSTILFLQSVPSSLPIHSPLTFALAAGFPFTSTLIPLPSRNSGALPHMTGGNWRQGDYCDSLVSRVDLHSSNKASSKTLEPYHHCPVWPRFIHSSA